MLEIEIVVLISTMLIALLSGILSVFMTFNYFRRRQPSYIFWSMGLWLFTFGVVLEALFAANVYSEALIDIYLFVVVVLVESLALGSAFTTKGIVFKCLYLLYVLVVSLVMVIALVTSDIGNVLVTYVVYGALPLSVVVVSSLGTFPAAAILIIVAALAYRRRRNAKMLSIIAGTLIVSIAGALYIAAVPEFLYFAEFVGIVLLWFGFFEFGFNKHRHEIAKASPTRTTSIPKAHKRSIKAKRTGRAASKKRRNR